MLTLLSGVSCGLGLFLLGMKFLTAGLNNLASGKFKNKMQNANIHPLMGVLIGTLTTMIIQSSSGATVIIVGLVEAKLLTLPQATPMIMGANIGTTITAQLVAFQFGKYAALLLIVGVILSMINKRKISLLGEAIIGISLLFIGIDFLSKGLAPLQNYIRFQEILAELGNRPFLGVLMGFATTAIIQSSGTGIAILQTLATNNTLTVYAAVPILLGQNIGTCITTLIASVNLSIVGKKAAIIHLLFNFIGAALLFPFINLLSTIAFQLAPLNPARQIAHAHSIFNILVTLLLLPFSIYLVKLANVIIKK